MNLWSLYCNAYPHYPRNEWDSKHHNNLAGLNSGHSNSPELKGLLIPKKKQLSLDDAHESLDEKRRRKIAMSASSKATMNSFSKTSSSTQSSAEQPYRSRAKSSAEERSKSLLYCPDIERVEHTRFPSYSTKSVEIFSESSSILLDSAGDISDNAALHRSVSQDSAPLNLQNIKEVKPKYSSRALFIKKPAVSLINVHLCARVNVCECVCVPMWMCTCAWVLMLMYIHTYTCTVHPCIYIQEWRISNASHMRLMCIVRTHNHYCTP